jgi:prepilin-type N-terminal cleavage/methylation domain-containing protein
VSAGIARRRARPFGDDDGMSLIEVLASMSVMTVLLAVVTGALIHGYRLTTRAESNSVAQSQVTVALQRMDRQVRYAAGIAAPYQVAGVPYVRYEVVEPGARRCYETRVQNGNLQQRSRPLGAASYSAWTTLAGGVRLTDPDTGAAVVPFTLLDATDANDHQRLRVQVFAQSRGGSAATRDGDVTFTALNTTRVAPISVC